MLCTCESAALIHIHQEGCAAGGRPLLLTHMFTFVPVTTELRRYISSSRSSCFIYDL